jgi:hypothetical protein
MRKYNYRTTVHIEDTIIKLGFRAKLPEDFKGEKVRVIFLFLVGVGKKTFTLEKLRKKLLRYSRFVKNFHIA